MRYNYLKKISLILDSLKIKHVIFDGALLGFIRDKSFIEWDWDAEISISYSDFEENVLNIIRLIEQQSIGKIILNKSYENPKINIILNNNFKYTIQAFHYTEDKKHIYRQMYIYPSKFLDFIEKIEIKGYTFPIPKDAIELLELEYGKEWKKPLNSKDKNSYLSSDVYTKKNNYITNKLIRIKLKIKTYFHILINSFEKIFRRFHKIQYLIGAGRERHFIYQIHNTAKESKNIVLIEIGSSDLSESIIFSNLNKNKKIRTNVYEADEITFKYLIEKKRKHKLASTNIFNKAITPDSKQYYLKKSNKKNLNRIIKKENTNTKNKCLEIDKTLQFKEIKELYDKDTHTIVKMDIEGIEEELIIQNQLILSKLNDISICMELHQQKYRKPNELKQAILFLLDNGYKIQYLEFSMYCNEKIRKSFCNNKNIISRSSKRYLIKDPSESIINEITFPDYRLIKKSPYYSSKNVRSITLKKVETWQ